MRNDNWQWNSRWAWKPFNRRSFKYGYRRAKESEADYRRSELRGKLMGFFWGILWCLQIVFMLIAVNIIVQDHDTVVRSATTIAR
jgi:hypothetical protein